MAKVQYFGTGRRKTSVARVRLLPGEGKFVINGRDIDEYFGMETLKVIAKQPLTLTGTTDTFDVIVNVYGGGFTGQAGAIRHGIARALLEADANLRPKERNTVSKKHVVRHSSPRDNYTKIIKPRNGLFPGFFVF